VIGNETGVPVRRDGDPGRAEPKASSEVTSLYGRSWVCPWMDAAPGPGRSPLPSTAVKVGGMQNTLTSVSDLSGSPVAMAPVGAPFSVMVRAAPAPKAPELRCLHAVQGWFPPPPHPVVNPAHSPSLVHGTPGFLNDALLGSLQKPQKTRAWPIGSSTAVFVTVPVVSR